MPLLLQKLENNSQEVVSFVFNIIKLDTLGVVVSGMDIGTIEID